MYVFRNDYHFIDSLFAAIHAPFGCGGGGGREMKTAELIDSEEIIRGKSRAPLPVTRATRGGVLRSLVGGNVYARRKMKYL